MTIIIIGPDRTETLPFLDHSDYDWVHKNGQLRVPTHSDPQTVSAHQIQHVNCTISTQCQYCQDAMMSHLVIIIAQ